MATPHVAAAVARYAVTGGTLPAIQRAALRIRVQRGIRAERGERAGDAESCGDAAEERRKDGPWHDDEHREHRDPDRARKRGRERLLQKRRDARAGRQRADLRLAEKARAR